MELQTQICKKNKNCKGGSPSIFITIDLGLFGNSALTDNIEVPKNQEIGKEIPITYVPVRNTIFLSYALAYAEVNNIFDIFIGVNAWELPIQENISFSSWFVIILLIMPK